MAPTDRVSDAERESAVASLREHVGTGRLTLAEFDTRTATAYAAVTRADLDAVRADLPVVSVGTSSRTPSRTPSRVQARSAWLTWLVVGALCTGIWLITCIASMSLQYPWPVWVVGPWGAMLALGTLTGTSVGCSSKSRQSWDRARSDSRSASRSKVDVETKISSAPIRSTS